MKIKLVSLTENGNLIVDNRRLQKVVVTKEDMDKIKYKPIVYNKNQQFLNYEDRYSVAKYNYEFAVGVIKEAYIEDYKEFEEKCKICKRYKRNCSILQDCKDNRINENIELIDKIWKCIKFSKVIDK